MTIIEALKKSLKVRRCFWDDNDFLYWDQEKCTWIMENGENFVGFDIDFYFNEDWEPYFNKNKAIAWAETKGYKAMFYSKEDFIEGKITYKTIKDLLEEHSNDTDFVGYLIVNFMKKTGDKND